MRKFDLNGKLRFYPSEMRYDADRGEDAAWIPTSWHKKQEGFSSPNLNCECGNTKFSVCWWDYPFAGGYCKIKCSECGEELLLIDDYS